MKFDQEDFETTEGLLRDVMRKQAGSIEKAVLEGVMNSIDAGASEVHIDLTKDNLTISDNGKGMVKDEISEYFKKFGLKDDDIKDKEFGKFRMGRGQIFNFGINRWYTNDYVLVVNLEEPHTDVEIDGEEHTVDTSGLGFSFGEGTGRDVDGCRIEVELFEPIDNVSSKVSDIESQIEYMSWFHDVEITVNNKMVDNELDYTHSSEYSFIQFDRSTFKSTSVIYNKGARVKTEKLGPVYARVISREDLDLNFARNDVLSGCGVYERIEQDYIRSLRSYLLDGVEVNDLSNSEVKWLIEQALTDSSFMAKIKETQLVTDIAGVSHSLSDLIGSRITFSSEKNNMGKEVCRRTSSIVLPESLESTFRDSDKFDFKPLSDIVDSEFKYEMQEYSEDNLSKRRKKNLHILKWAMNELGIFDVKSGSSKHRDVWMEDDRTVLVDKDFMNVKKQKLATDVLLAVIREAAHKQNTKQDPDEDFSYDRRLKDMLDDLAATQRAILSNNRELKGYLDSKLD